MTQSRMCSTISLFRIDGAPATSALQHQPSSERYDACRQLGSRISKGKAAAERSAIADGSVRDMGHGLGDQRRVLRYQLVTLHLDVARHGAYAKHIALEFDAREAFDRIDIDQDRGRAQTHIERWHQALPAHQDPRPLAVFFQQGKRFGQRTWS
jgi:hypothetical protein